MEAGGADSEATPRVGAPPSAALARGLVIGPQPAASAPKAFPSGVAAVSASTSAARTAVLTASAAPAGTAPGPQPKSTSPVPQPKSTTPVPQPKSATPVADKSTTPPVNESATPAGDKGQTPVKVKSTPSASVRSSTPAEGKGSKPAGVKNPAPSSVRSSNEGSPRRQNHRKHRRPSRDREQNQPGKDNHLKVIVTGYPPYTQPQDLTRVFVKFGSVLIEKVNNKYAILVYLDEDNAKAAVQASKKVNVYGEFLNVKEYTEARHAELISKQNAPKRDFTRSKQSGMIIDPKEIDLSGEFPQQLERVLAGVRLTQEDVAALGVLYTDLETALQLQWPGCTAIPFGSITTGLGVKSSDADCFIHVPAQFRHPHANFVNKAKRVLQQFPDVFAEILSIPRANTPIVKFFHVPTQTNCDLTFKTPLGAQNSKLVAYLLHSDPRLLPMAVVIKYWAKVHDFSGTGRLTNYALTLLIIFYLQQPPMSILPSVERLQRDPKNDCIVDFWNTGFLREKDSLPECSNTSSISELIGGFFEYYSSFNFEDMVVCPFMGTPIKKDAFQDLSLLPKEFNRYKTNVLGKIALPMRSNTAMCVQDPFEQCHNVASAINGKLAVEIKAYFKFAANAYEKEKLANCEHFLETILLQKPKLIRAKSHPEYRVNLFPRIIMTIIDPDWKPVVRDLVFVIFEKILKIDLGKMEDKVINPDTKRERERYTATLTRPVWKRKQFSRLYSIVNLGFLEKQVKITEELLKVDKQAAFHVQLQVSLTLSAEPRSALVSVRLAAGDQAAFREFGKFFISVMQGWFMNLLRPYARPPEPDSQAKIAETIKMLDSNMEPAGDSDDDSLMVILDTTVPEPRGCGQSEALPSAPGEAGAEAVH